MNSRERVMRSINLQEADKVPVDFGGTVVTSVDLNLHKKLREKFGIEGEEENIDYSMGTAGVDRKLVEIFHSDVVRIGLNVVKPDIINGYYENGFGIGHKKAEPHEYFDVVKSPLADVDSPAGMQMPDPDDPRMYEGLRERARDLYENTDYAIFADFGIPGFYETGQKLRGYENFACDLLINEDFVYELYEKLLDLQKRWFKNYLEQVGGYACAVGYADDLGMQDRLQISPEVYRKIVKPYHEKIFKFIHEQADIKIMIHSCGAIFPIVGELIDSGVDIINPMQTRATGMDPFELKKTYGDKAVFWGGFDEQQVLPFGSREEIFAETERLMDAMGKSGFVFGPGHNIQADTPVDNVISLFEAAEKYR